MWGQRKRRVMVERHSPEIPQWSGSHSKNGYGTGKSTNDRKSRRLFGGIGVFLICVHRAF